ncbi:hypothetical protein H310_14515 [Aphanomyces invadans]|uniref:Tc1-like transposase DDE domain-containing protein n=1 Tax=Aphanomyces invadans TaxID=157072 RepID=A0A024TAT1_9STRA|nr:hypothetical protein H310_14515 [Aphanomyces invadans]ETV90726.1 hypothetical protein H310_14515 [Aphanomyces invadans]|eukprot:XP_008880616.1 hypothetical protein H310_14515 [Aphanomyces invadans]
MKQRWILKRTCWTRPALKEHHKQERINHKFFTSDLGNESHNELFNVVHVAENWFYITKIRRPFYMWTDEEKPSRRQLQGVSHITKATPWVGRQGGMLAVLALHGSEEDCVNRPAGTIVYKPVSVTRDVYRSYLVDKVIPALKQKWRPFSYDAPPTTFVQQDNAKSHVAPDDVSVVSSCMSGGWDIRVLNQPAQSPDMNVLDLGFFNSIQALQQRIECSSIEDLVCTVEQSFEDLAPSTLDKTFGTLLRVCSKRA